MSEITDFRDEKLKIEFMLSQILQLRFGDGTGENPQVYIATREIMELLTDTVLKTLEMVRLDIDFKLNVGSYNDAVSALNGKIEAIRKGLEE